MYVPQYDTAVLDVMTPPGSEINEYQAKLHRKALEKFRKIERKMMKKNYGANDAADFDADETLESEALPTGIPRREMTIVIGGKVRPLVMKKGKVRLSKKAKKTLWKQVYNKVATKRGFNGMKVPKRKSVKLYATDGMGIVARGTSARGGIVARGNTCGGSLAAVGKVVGAIAPVILSMASPLIKKGLEYLVNKFKAWREKRKSGKTKAGRGLGGMINPSMLVAPSKKKIVPVFSGKMDRKSLLRDAMMTAEKHFEQMLPGQGRKIAKYASNHVYGKGVTNRIYRKNYTPKTRKSTFSTYGLAKTLITNGLKGRKYGKKGGGYTRLDANSRVIMKAYLEKLKRFMDQRPQKARGSGVATDLVKSMYYFIKDMELWNKLSDLPPQLFEKIKPFLAPLINMLPSVHTQWGVMPSFPTAPARLVEKALKPLIPTFPSPFDPPVILPPHAKTLEAIAQELPPLSTIKSMGKQGINALAAIIIGSILRDASKKRKEKAPMTSEILSRAATAAEKVINPSPYEENLRRLAETGRTYTTTRTTVEPMTKEETAASEAVPRELIKDIKKRAKGKQPKPKESGSGVPGQPSQLEQEWAGNEPIAPPVFPGSHGGNPMKQKKRGVKAMDVAIGQGISTAQSLRSGRKATAVYRSSKKVADGQ